MVETTNYEEIGYKWVPIKDLPENWELLCNPELTSLASVWAEQHDQLKKSKSVQEFNERLLREWSIETGIIERLYTIDRGITQLLVEQGIDAALIPHGTTNLPVSELVNILQDHRNSLEGLFDFIEQRRPLTENYIRQLHQVITSSQKFVEGVDQFGNILRLELLRGEWKKLPNNPKRPDGCEHEYCPPLQVVGEMERLVSFFQSHKDVPPEINSAWLHHRFTQIYPFQDGNGRARALATLVFLQAGWFPLVINRDQRGEYITALEAADAGDLKLLINLFGQNAKRAFARALTLSEDALQADTALPKMVDNLVSLYQTRRSATEEIYQGVEALANQLSQEIYSFLVEVARELQQKFANVSLSPVIHVTRSKPDNSYYYTKEIIDAAKDFGYWANVSRHRMWVRLHLFDRFDESKTQLVFSFHYLGKVNRGVMVCTSFLFIPENKPDVKPELYEEIEPQFGEAHRICREPFYFSYQDKNQCDNLIADFRKWVSEAVTIGLAEYAQRL